MKKGPEQPFLFLFLRTAYHKIICFCTVFSTSHYIDSTHGKQENKHAQTRDNDRLRLLSALPQASRPVARMNDRQHTSCE
jgi:hypothetical protein